MKKILHHAIGALLILFGWYICVTNVGLDRGAVTFRYFSPMNVVGLSLIFLGAYFPETMGFFTKKKT